MKNFQIFLFSLVFLVLPKYGEAQTQMSLAECVQYGLGHSPTIQRQRLDIAKADEKMKEVKAAWMPQVIYNPAIALNIKSAEMGKKTGALNIQKTEEQMMYDIASAYYAAQVSKVQMGIIEANRDRIKQLVTITKVQYDNGFAKKTDYNRLIVNQTNLETDLQNLDVNYRQQMTMLKYYMGIPLSTDVVLSDKTDTELYKNLTTDLADVTKNSTDFKLIQVQKSMNDLQMAQLKASYMPTVGVGLRFNYQTQQNTLNIFGKESNWLPTAALAINASIPIFDGFKKKSKAAQAKIELEQLRFDEQNLKNSLELQNENARYKLQLNQAAVTTQTNNIQLAEEVYKATQVQYMKAASCLFLNC